MNRALPALAAVILAALVLSACGGASTTTEPVAVDAPPEAAVNVAVPTTAPALEEPTAAPEAAAEPTAADDVALEGAVTAARLDVNAATEAELATIPGVGERMIREFLEYRPYDSIEQFRREIGKYVDEATVAGYEAYIYVPVDPNAADEATLMQLPGVDAAAAAELAAGRPYVDRDAFLAALGALVTADELAAGSPIVAAP